jgi:hypothetical protein
MRLLDHFRTEIHSDTEGRLGGGKPLPGPATELDDTQSIRDEEFQITDVLAVKEARLVEPLRTSGRELVLDAAELAFANGNDRIRRWCGIAQYRHPRALCPSGRKTVQAIRARKKNKELHHAR